MTSNPSRRREEPITDVVVANFMAAYGWMASSRHPRDRMAYRVAEYLLDQNSQLKMKLAGEAVQQDDKWQQRLKGSKA